MATRKRITTATLFPGSPSAARKTKKKTGRAAAGVVGNKALTTGRDATNHALDVLGRVADATSRTMKASIRAGGQVAKATAGLGSVAMLGDKPGRRKVGPTERKTVATAPKRKVAGAAAKRKAVKTGTKRKDGRTKR
jgi:hypothetical protein